MTTEKPQPLTQANRQPPSVPMDDADLKIGNANWTKGLQSMSDWIWSANLNPEAFPNNLARFFLQVPGIFEQQLNFSTTLIFDEPSFKNGIQISGFVDRVARELAISLIGQRRRSWYTMTHHAVLGRLTAIKHGLSEKDFENKWGNLTEHKKNKQHYSRVERAVLEFADAFGTNPKAYSDAQFKELRAALMEDNAARYPGNGRWMAQLAASRVARAEALLVGISEEEADRRSRKAAGKTSGKINKDLNERMVNAQVLELAFLCLQFVALACVLTGLNIPDEDFLPDVMKQLLPASIIKKLNAFNEAGGKGMKDLLPPPVNVPVKDIIADRVTVEPAPLKGKRIPMVSYEDPTRGDLDKGLTVGGIQVGVWGWGFGAHFPGSLAYCLMHHPELARYEAPYSLPVLFNEDEWRNGVQTSGYVSRRLKEIVIQKVYRLNRGRYGIEHHTMFLYNTYFDEHGVGRPPQPKFNEAQQEKAREVALQRAHNAIFYMLDHEKAPAGVYTPLEIVAMAWTEALMRTPHKAYERELPLREALWDENDREIEAGLRRLDLSGEVGEGMARDRLIHHQIAELAMMIGHMDGLGRAMTILQLEAEDPVQAIEGKAGPSGGIIPKTDKDGQAIFTGVFNNRPGLHQILSFIGLNEAVLTLNELMVNPRLNQKVKKELKKKKKVRISAATAAKTGEF